MYKEVGKVSEEVIQSLRWLIDEVEWRTVDTEGKYQIWHPKERLHGIIKTGDWDSFFLKLRPGDFIHKHVDNEKPYQTFHIPIYTNAACLCFSEDEAYHLEVGKRYWVDRTVLHWSTNDGHTDRIHLLQAL